MSGHSKWAKIHRQKGVADAKRGAVFTRLGNNITIAVKSGGGGDPSTNFKLQLAIDKAKASNMPKDNIERAIKRGTGEGDGGPIEEVNYEGFGPDGVAVIIECLTDNRNRTSASIKHIFSKHSGSLGGPNSVSWMFEQQGVIRVKSVDEALELELIDAGALDIDREQEGVTIYTPFTELQKIKKLLEARSIEVESAEIEQVPKEIKNIDSTTEEKLIKMFEALDEDGDVNNYFTNTDA